MARILLPHRRTRVADAAAEASDDPADQATS
jgi:hypothetical protein